MCVWYYFFYFISFFGVLLLTKSCQVCSLCMNQTANRRINKNFRSSVSLELIQWTKPECCVPFMFVPEFLDFFL